MQWKENVQVPPLQHPHTNTNTRNKIHGFLLNMKVYETNIFPSLDDLPTYSCIFFYMNICIVTQIVVILQQSMTKLCVLLIPFKIARMTFCGRPFNGDPWAVPRWSMLYNPYICCYLCHYDIWIFYVVIAVLLNRSNTQPSCTRQAHYRWTHPVSMIDTWLSRTSWTSSKTITFAPPLFIIIIFMIKTLLHLRWVSYYRHLW